MATRKSVFPNELLSYEREQRHWTQEDIAEFIGAPDAKMIGRWERGIVAPSPHYRQKLEALFGKSGRELGLVNRDGIPFWSVPYHRNLYFTGREALLAQLHSVFNTPRDSTHISPQILTGLGGTGKSQVALEYAYRYRNEYHTVAWIRAYSRETVEADITAFAEVLNLPEKDVHNREQVIQAVRQWLSKMTHWLLIIDNADDLSLVEQTLPSFSHGHILVTTRVSATGTLAQATLVETLGLDEGAYFLLRRAKMLPLDADSRDIPYDKLRLARGISELLGGLALALDQAGAYIEETSCGLENFFKRYQDYREIILQERGTPSIEHPDAIATTWSLAFENIQQNNPIAIELLSFLAFLVPDAIPEDLLSKGAQELGPVLAPIAANPLILDAAIRDLQKYSLVRRNPEKNILGLHQLVQTVILDKMDESTQQQWAERVVYALNHVFPDGEFKTWKQCEQLLPQALVGAELIEHWHMCFHEAAQLLRRVGRYQQRRAQLSNVEHFYLQALSIEQTLSGPEHLDVATLLNDYGELYFYINKSAQAETLYLRALNIRERYLAPDDPRLAESMVNLGMIYVDMENYAMAETLYLRALSIRQRTLPADHPDLAPSFRELGFLAYKQRKLDEAETFFRQALAVSEKSLGPEHIEIGVDLINMAGVCRDQGNYDEAEQLYSRVLSLCERILGPDDPDVAHASGGLAKLYIAQGKYALAKSLLQRAYIIQVKTFGSNNSYAQHLLHTLQEVEQEINQPY